MILLRSFFIYFVSCFHSSKPAMKNLKLEPQRYLVVQMGGPGALNQITHSQLVFETCLQLSLEAKTLSCLLPLRYTTLLGHLLCSKFLMTRVSPICPHPSKAFSPVMEMSPNGIDLELLRNRQIRMKEETRPSQYDVVSS